ncbi:MAG: hypothetical protein LBD37_08700 [Treponema sp.]|nr:hypothetical protein [Treponema sp.]
MIEKRAVSLFFTFFLVFPAFFAFAQEESPNPDEIPIESNWPELMPNLYSQGDKLFTIAGGALFPMLFLYENAEPYTGNINIGGTGYLGFSYFLGPNLFVGAEIGGMFAQTLMMNLIYIIPIGVKIGYQFLAGPFGLPLEFPLSVLVGAAPTKYLDRDYLGMILKPQAGAFWRFHADWSAGINLGWWWVPQWPKNHPEFNRYGNFLELTLAVRYHL